MEKNKMPKRVLNLNVKFDVKAIDDEEKITIQGYANTTTTDRVGDVILEEAWTKGGLDNYLKNPIVLAFHDHSKPIGEVVDYSINNRGLHVVAEISKAAGEVYSLVKSGILKTFSVGFRVKDADYDQTTDLFVIKDLELFEISVVSVPANADSVFSLRKGFESDSEYNSFKSLFNTQTNLENTDIIGDKNVDKVSLTPEELEVIKNTAVAEAMALQAAEAAKTKSFEDLAVSAGTTGAERLLKDVESKFAASNDSLAATLAELRAELAEKSVEIQSIQRSKMSFEERGNKSAVSDADTNKAVLLSIITGKSLENTKFGKDLIEKATGAHLAGNTTPGDWENTFSTRMYEGIMDKLIIEPLFTNRIQMPSRTLVIPYNPEAGYASWVADTAFKSDSGQSTAPDSTHTFRDITLKTEKLASREYIGYEEEEDAILPLLGMIENAIMRRMARTTDTELLRANEGSESASGIENAPTDFNGVATLAVDNSKTVQLGGTLAAPAAVTVADLAAMRRKMSRYGMNPSDVLFVVNETAYYDLLEDPDFRTMDLVGGSATILTGQIGSVGGSRVIVSDSFGSGASTPAAIAINTSNYIFGEQRGLMVERDRDIINQKNVIVATRRFAFSQIIPSTGSCVALLNPAS